MKYDDKVSLIGIYQGRLMLFIMELFSEEYICKRCVNLGKNDKLAIHSIINSGNSVYLADSHNNKIYRYNYILNEFSDVTVGRDPRHMAVDKENMYVANNDKLYTCCYEENEIIEYSGNKEIIRRFTTEGKPMHMFMLDDCLIVMTYFVNGNVHTKINFIDIESNKIKKTVLIEGLASDFDIDYKRQLLFLINIDDKNLYIIDAVKKEILKTIFVGGYPESLTVGTDNIYVTNSKKNHITVVESDKLTASKVINLEFTPSCIKVIN